MSNTRKDPVSDKLKDAVQENTSALTLFDPTPAQYSGLPAHVRTALQKYKTRDLTGIAPDWRPETPDAFILGTIIAERLAGKHSKAFQEKHPGQANVVVIQTIDGPYSLWFGADLALKFQGRASLLGANVVVVFKGYSRKVEGKGWVDVTTQVRDKNDMRNYQVTEVIGLKEEEDNSSN